MGRFPASFTLEQRLGSQDMMVMKFGGTSVESADAIERAARIVSSRLKRCPVVVVSAMAKVTDQLVCMGQHAASGDCESALDLLKELRERHLQTAAELVGAKRSASLAPRLEVHFSGLKN